MKPYLYAFGAVLCWASLPAATGGGLSGLNSEQLMFYSFVPAAVYLYLQKRLLTGTWKLYLPKPKVMLAGVWGIFLYHYFYYIALDHAPLAEGAILATTWSFWIVVFSSIITFRRLRFSIVLVALAGMAGVTLVIASGKEVGFSSEYLFGYLMALGCGFIWSTFSVSLKYMRTPEDPMPLFTIIAAVLSTVLFLVRGDFTLPNTTALLSAVYLGLVPLGLSFFLWNKGISTGDVSRIGFLSYFTTPLAVLLVAVLYVQPVAPQVLAGMGCILGAAVVGNILLRR